MLLAEVPENNLYKFTSHKVKLVLYSSTTAKPVDNTYGSENSVDCMTSSRILSYAIQWEFNAR